MMLSRVRLAIAGVLGAGVFVIIGLGYHHYTSLLAERDVLRADNATLEMAVKAQQVTIDAQVVAISEWRGALAELSARVEEMERVSRKAVAETRRLNELFSQHDFGRLGLERPGLIGPRINAGSDRAIRLLECATGAGGEDCPN